MSSIWLCHWVAKSLSFRYKLLKSCKVGVGKYSSSVIVQQFLPAVGHSGGSSFKMGHVKSPLSSSWMLIVAPSPFSSSWTVFFAKIHWWSHPKTIYLLYIKIVFIGSKYPEKKKSTQNHWSWTVTLIPLLHQIFFGYFDTVNIFFDNTNNIKIRVTWPIFLARNASLVLNSALSHALMIVKFQLSMSASSPPKMCCERQRRVRCFLFRHQINCSLGHFDPVNIIYL